jgi:hypothetical protein
VATADLEEYDQEFYDICRVLDFRFDLVQFRVSFVAQIATAALSNPVAPITLSRAPRSHCVGHTTNHFTFHR